MDLQDQSGHNNFKGQQQQGEPNYHTSKSPDTDQNKNQQEQSSDEQSKQDHASDEPEIPGPNEKPEQQKVGGA